MGSPERRETIAWIVLIAFASLLRLVRLEDPPLDVEEGRRALEALALWRGDSVTYQAGPLLSNATSLVFGLFGTGDGQARLVPALAGIAVVASAWLLRPVFGPFASWCAGAMLAVCPTLVLASRSVSPAMLIVLFALVTAVCGYRFAAGGGRGSLVAIAVSTALGLTADPAFALAVLGLVLGVAILEGDPSARPAWLAQLRAHGRGALAIGALVGALASSRLLMNLPGIQAGLVDSLWRWTADVGRGAGSLAPVLLALVEGGTLVLAAIRLATRARHDRAARLLAVWLAVALALSALVRQPDLRYLSHPTLPAALLAGLGLHDLLAAIARRPTLRSAVFSALALVPLVTATFQINTGLRQGGSPWALASVVAGAGLLCVFLLAVSRLDRAELGSAVAGFGVVVVGLSLIGTTSRLLEAGGAARSQILEGSVVTDEVLVLREHALKAQRADPTGAVAVDPALQPLVGWALRDVRTVSGGAVGTGPPGLQVLADAPPATSSASTRLVVGYAVEAHSPDLSPSRIWRWLFGRQGLAEVRPYAIVVVQPAGR